jgi:hypothetical protein
MANNPAAGPIAASAAEAQLARIAANGCARHPHLLTLVEGSGPHAGRDLADAVHLLCHLHGRYPGLVELTLSGSAATSREAPWLAHTAQVFERERLFIVRLTAAVGPMPSTPGAAQTEASLSAQRNALETLAGSERRGCALGAAAALVGDWRAVRRLLDRAAARVGLDSPPSAMPDDRSVLAALDTMAGSTASERAVAFGGDQLLLQHRGLFDLLEARASARGDY